MVRQRLLANFGTYLDWAVSDQVFERIFRRRAFMGAASNQREKGSGGAGNLRSVDNIRNFYSNTGILAFLMPLCPSIHCVSFHDALLFRVGIVGRGCIHFHLRHPVRNQRP